MGESTSWNCCIEQRHHTVLGEVWPPVFDVVCILLSSFLRALSLPQGLPKGLFCDVVVWRMPGSSRFSLASQTHVPESQMLSPVFQRACSTGALVYLRPGLAPEGGSGSGY